jgi:hypothetical protein
MASDPKGVHSQMDVRERAAQREGHRQDVSDRAIEDVMLSI